MNKSDIQFQAMQFTAYAVRHMDRVYFWRLFEQWADSKDLLVEDRVEIRNCLETDGKNEIV